MLCPLPYGYDKSKLNNRNGAGQTCPVASKKYDMANEKNLKPPQSTSEARERGKKGGIASGKARLVKNGVVSVGIC